MENITREIFDCEEFTVPCTVPKYWNDADAWNDGTALDPIPFPGIFEAPYTRLDLGDAGQDSALPHVSFLTENIPNAREAAEIVVDGVAYRVGTARPTGAGVTDCTLYVLD